MVDPLATGGLGPLGELLADPAIEIVFHDADYDLRLLNREYGYTAKHLFDTRIAAQLLNEPGVGLAALLEKYLGVRLDKRFQRADWSARPLSPEMLEYAASDTRYLPQLRDILRQQLEERGRLGWAAGGVRTAGGHPSEPPGPAEPGWLRLKGAKALKGRELAILRELWEWREGAARRADRATFRILNNEPMLAMAKHAAHGPGRPQGDSGRRAADQAERRGRDILAAVRRGLELPETGPAPARAPAAPGAGPGLRGTARAAQGRPQPAGAGVRPGTRASCAPTGRWRRSPGWTRRRGRAGRRDRAAAMAAAGVRRGVCSKGLRRHGRGGTARASVRTRERPGPGDPSSPESSTDPTPARPRRSAPPPGPPPPASHHR